MCMNKHYHNFITRINPIFLEKISLEYLDFFTEARLGACIAKGRMEGENVYLKYADSPLSLSELTHEARLLSLLSNHLPVAKSLYFFETKTNALLITSEIEGVPVHESTLDPYLLIDKIVDLLHRFQDVFPLLKEGLSHAFLNEVKSIESLIKENKINEELFFSKTQKTPVYFLKKLKEKADNLIPSSFSHGDFCLPNLIITPDEKLSLIDLGKAGGSELQRDIFSMHKSILRNFGEEGGNYFLEKYLLISKDLIKDQNLYEITDQFFYASEYF